MVNSAFGRVFSDSQLFLDPFCSDCLILKTVYSDPQFMAVGGVVALTPLFRIFGARTVVALTL
jgi:hypothetical protein